MLPQGTHWFPKKISQFGLDVWPAIANLYTDKQIYNYISI